MNVKRAAFITLALAIVPPVNPSAAQTAEPSAQSGADFGSDSSKNEHTDNSSASATDDKPSERAQDATSRPAETTPSPSSQGEANTSSSAEAKKAVSDQTPDAQAEKDTQQRSADVKDAEASGVDAKTETASETNTGSENSPAASPADKPTASINTDVTKEPERLTVASWGGAYTESQKRAYFSPFQDETGIAIETVLHKGKFEPLSPSGDTASPKWDIVDIDPSTLERACREGVLEKVSPSALEETKDGTPASSDFLPGTLHECGIPSVAWSSAIVFDKRAFKKAKPKTAKDFFDTKRFPGKRALPRDPKYVMELALMAAGTEPEKVYEELSTQEGVDRAFAQLELIRDDILWWEKAHQPLKLLAKKHAAMALAFNGRIFSAIVAANKPFDIVWDGQVFDLDFWAIPKGSPRKDKSLKFIAFATRPEAMAKQASWFPYGPVRKSAIAMVGKHPEVNVDMTAYIPTAPANFKRALRLDTLWWKEHGEKIRNRYGAWIDAMIDSTSFEDEQQ